MLRGAHATIKAEMFADLQQWLALLIMLVPGFIVTSIQRGFRPKRFATQFDWLATSVLWGVSLNAMVLVLIVLTIALTIADYRVLTIEEVGRRFRDFKIAWLVWYFVSLYFLSAIWGIILGKWPVLGLRAILNRLGITSYAEQSSVWDRIFDKQVPADKRAVWVRIRLTEGATMFGRLRHSSARVEQDKPIEVYVSPCYELTADGWKRASLLKGDEISDGIYLKIINEHSVEFFFKDRDWTFSEGEKT